MTEIVPLRVSTLMNEYKNILFPFLKIKPADHLFFINVEDDSSSGKMFAD